MPYHLFIFLTLVFGAASFAHSANSSATNNGDKSLQNIDFRGVNKNSILENEAENFRKYSTDSNSKMKESNHHNMTRYSVLPSHRKKSLATNDERESTATNSVQQERLKPDAYAPDRRTRYRLKLTKNRFEDEFNRNIPNKRDHRHPSNRKQRQHERQRQQQQQQQRMKRQQSSADGLSGIDDIVDMLGPRKQADIVIAIARSIGVGMRNFYTNERPLVKSVLRQFATLHPDYVRASLITFAKSATLVFDSIGGSATADQCTFFSGGVGGAVPPFDLMVFNNSESERSGCNLKSVMSLARQTFSVGRVKRPNAKQILLIMTDGNVPSVGDQDPIGEDWRIMNDNNVSIFAVGIGVWLMPLAVRAIVTTGPTKSYYGNLLDWQDMLRNNKKIQNSEYSAVYSSLNASYCSETCSRDMACYCDVHSARAGCTCRPGFKLSPVSRHCEAVSVGIYKSEAGPDGWTNCNYGYTTSNIASTKSSDCICYDAARCTVRDACVDKPCGTNRPCSTLWNGTYECGPCYSGWKGPDCGQTDVTCANNFWCQNGAQCVVRGNQLLCLCGFGNDGPQCASTDDYCKFSICTNNATCISGTNNFQCNCPPAWIGDFCQDSSSLVGPSTTSTLMVNSVNSVAYPSTPSLLVESNKGEQPKNDNLIIIIACSIGGAVLLLLLIILIVGCVFYRKRKNNAPEAKPTFENGTSTDGLYNSVRTVKLQKNNSKIFNKMSVRFSGFWNKGTVRGYSDCGGLPSVPTKYPNGKADGMQNVDLGETMLEQEIINDSKRMDGWNQYLKELYIAGSVDRAVLARLDNKDIASTMTWHLDWDEIYSLDLLLTNGKSDKVESVEIQQSTFLLDVDRKNQFASGEGVNGDQKIKAVVGRSKRYLVAGLAKLSDDEMDDDDAVTKEIKWIIDHVAAEGY